MSRKSVVVEFLGMPGVGKSTLTARVAEKLAQRGVPVCRAGKRARFENANLYLSFIASHPGYAFASVRAIIASRQRTLRDLTWVAMTWLKRSARIRRYKFENGVRLVDPGIFQALWSIGFSSRKTNLAALYGRLQNRMFVSDLAVIVEADAGTIRCRLEARPGRTSRLERWSGNGTETFTRAANVMRQVKETVASVAATRAGMRVITINNDGETLEANAERIADAIGKLFSEDSDDPPTTR